MSLYENTVTRPHAEKPQAAKHVTFANKKTRTLYPSLPSINRCDFLVADRSVEEELHLTLPPAEKQSDAPAACSEARWKAQFLKVEEQNRELVSINERWAEEYSTMRQYYKEKVQHLEALLQHDYSQFEETSEELNTKPFVKFNPKTLKDTKSSTTDISSELLTVKQEAEELREQNSTLTRRGQHQAEEIRRLNKALQEALQTTTRSEETLQEVWKQQAEVYKEDFLKERKDREKLKGKCLDLEKKFKKVYSELHFLKSQVKWTLAPQPVPECKCKALTKSPDWEVQHINQHHMVLQRH